METIEQLYNSRGRLWWRGHLRIRTSAREIVLDDLNESDLLLILTANSVYSFSVTGAKEKSGLLMGGRLGERSLSAFIIGASNNADDEATNEGIIAVGSHTVFLVIEGSYARRLVTSTIKRLTHIKTPISRA